MSFFRSSIVLFVVSFFVMAAYGVEVLDDHCDDAKQTEIHQGAERGTPPTGDAHACQCICHGALLVPTVEKIDLLVREQAELESFVVCEETPPDSVPVGIEHPPQLA